jgi:hypothetical protein
MFVFVYFVKNVNNTRSTMLRMAHRLQHFPTFHLMGVWGGGVSHNLYSVSDGMHFYWHAL